MFRRESRGESLRQLPNTEILGAPTKDEGISPWPVC